MITLYYRKFINLDYAGIPEDPFSPRVPKISLTGPIWVSMKAKKDNFEIFW